MRDRLTRRDVLRSTAAVAAGGVLAGLSPRTWAAPSGPQTGASAGARPPQRRVLRVAHLTDIHVQPERRADQGMAACLKHVQEQKDRPDVIFTGGDLVMDSFEQSHSRTKLQWDLFTRILKDDCGLPLEHCLGNHDIWGWNRKKSETTGDEPQYGKKWAVELLGLPGMYRSIDRAGWHFVFLDSVSPDGDGYVGKLDDAQFEWLAADLKGVREKTPVMVVSHIPILAACVLNDTESKAEKERAFKVSTSLMMSDSRRIRTLFANHPNVKLCLSGHIHQVDRVDFNGVTYLCDGAVSGAWWRGRNHECSEGYALIDLYDDGRFDHQYVTYGWVAERA
jgi:3',5'-cyclic AMP phosphodiesterase CpdA